jgi:hypothetical protein
LARLGWSKYWMRKAVFVELFGREMKGLFGEKGIRF